jgi:hypothetical protein
MAPPMSAAPDVPAERLIARLAESPDSYPQKIDLVQEAALLVELGREAYRSASFLDDRILRPGTKAAWCPLARVERAAIRADIRRPVHWIFHTGHVGSTLVSRLLDEIPGVLGLREPHPLRTLAEARDSLGRVDSLLSEAGYRSLQARLLALWSRGYDDTQAVIVKAPSVTARVGASLLVEDERMRAIYLNIGPEPYLATLLASQGSGVDLRAYGQERMRRLEVRIPAGLEPLHALSPGECVAMSWLAESCTRLDLERRFGARMLAMSFDRFLGDVAGGMSRIAAHFGLAVGPRYASDAARSPLLGRYSKALEHEYSPALRAQILADSRERNREELRKGMRWLESLARANPAVAEAMAANEG